MNRYLFHKDIYFTNFHQKLKTILNITLPKKQVLKAKLWIAYPLYCYANVKQSPQLLYIFLKKLIIETYILFQIYSKI